MDEDVVDIVAHIHRQELYSSADTVVLHAAHHLYTITRTKVCWLLPFCLPCQGECAATSAPAPLQLIRSSLPLQLVQIYLIDRHLTPNNNYTWILHAEDHFCKVTALYPLINREALTVALAFQNWIMAYGPPSIVQCEDGTEFRGTSLTNFAILTSHNVIILSMADLIIRCSVSSSS